MAGIAVKMWIDRELSDAEVTVQTQNNVDVTTVELSDVLTVC